MRIETREGAGDVGSRGGDPDREVPDNEEGEAPAATREPGGPVPARGVGIPTGSASASVVVVVLVLITAVVVAGVAGPVALLALSPLVGSMTGLVRALGS